MKAQKYIIRAEWDEEATVWYVASSNVPGLATEAKTVDELIKKLTVMVPELVDLNGQKGSGGTGHAPFDLVTAVPACA